ncbi:MAG: hypothetical protein VR64_07970 [Desulfatitalea sp. BRH_c12]|nr:MAG: hypothetical protein VR64_07970 [Desulfatitalea sp. BRH_c12]
MTTQRVYTKLPGKKFFFLQRRTLWQGPDHLLWVESAFVQEHYKRFYYKDIQAVFLRRNQRQHLWTFLWGALLLGFGLLTLAIPDSGYLLPFLTAPWAFLLIVNIIKGPCCDVYLQTAVQLEKLSNQVRARSAGKTLDRIKVAAERAQGPLNPRALPVALTDAAAAASQLASNRPGRPAAPEPGEPFSPRLHRTLTVLLLAFGLLRVAQMWISSMTLAGLDLLGLGVLLPVAIVALVRWHRHLKGSLLATVTWLTLVLTLVQAATAYVVYIAAAIQHPDMVYNAGRIIPLFLELQMADHPLMAGLAIGFAAAALLLGAMGVAALWAIGREPRY